MMTVHTLDAARQGRSQRPLLNTSHATRIVMECESKLRPWSNLLLCGWFLQYLCLAWIINLGQPGLKLLREKKLGFFAILLTKYYCYNKLGLATCLSERIFHKLLRVVVVSIWFFQNWIAEGCWNQVSR